MGKNPVAGDTIRVCARFRPQNSVEKRNGGKVAIQVSPDGSVARILHPKQNLDFVFDKVFNIDSTQPKVYEYSVSHMIDQVMNGFNCTVFAYGQTGSGKTYSMEGSLGSPIRGIVPRLVENLFEAIEEADEIYEFVVKVTYVEIYLERLRDLLRPRNTAMRIRDSKHGVYIQNVTEMYVRDGQEVINLMALGAANRTVNSTNMNAVSSRSHGVFMVKVVTKDTNTGSTKMAKLMMVDLAGSEKVRKTGATGALLEEAKKINQSLSCLGSVMNALSEGQPFVPYRDSVLTRLLSDSLGGNCKTTLMVCASPSNWNQEETISTMRFGTRAKKVKNKAKVNAEKTAAEYKRELAAAMAKIASLKRLVLCLKRDLKMACAGQLTDPDEGTGARLEKGEKIDLGDDEPDTAGAAAPKKDPWAVQEPPKPAKSTKTNEVEGEEILLDEDDLEESEGPTTDDSQTTDNGSQKADSNEGQTSGPPTSPDEEEMDFSKAADAAIEQTSKGGTTSSSKKENRRLKRKESVTVKSAELKTLVTENDRLGEKVESLRQELLSAQTELMMKSESLIKEKEKTEEAEIECEKSVAQSRIYMDEAMRLKYERERLEREREDLSAELTDAKEELARYKTRAEQLESQQEDLIDDVRTEERAKVDEFIAQARAAISDRAAPVGGNAVTAALGRFSAPAGLSADQEVRQTKLDKIKLQQTLREKVQEYVDMKLKAYEAMDKVKKLEESVRRKDMRLRGQHNELVGLGQLKKEADKYHAETNANLEKEMKKMKKQNNELKQQVATLRQKQKQMKHAGDYERDEAPAAVKKKLKSMVMPIRGGGKKKKRKKGRKKSAVTANDLHGMAPASYNNYHAKSPSMMNPGFMSTPQTMLYQPQYEMDGLQQDDILDGNIPEIPMMGPGMAPPGMSYYAQAQPVYPDPHNHRNNTFMQATNFWAPEF